MDCPRTISHAIQSQLKFLIYKHSTPSRSHPLLLLHPASLRSSKLPYISHAPRAHILPGQLRHIHYTVPLQRLDILLPQHALTHVAARALAVPEGIVCAARAVKIDHQHEDDQPCRARDQLQGVERCERQAEKNERDGEAHGEPVTFRDAWGAGEFVLVGEGDAAWGFVSR